MNVCQAIARMEGYYTPGTRPNRNANPGDIEYGKWAAAHGADRCESGILGRFAHFPTPEAGWAALKALLQSPGYAGKTVAQVVERYAPGTETDTAASVRAVCKLTGLTPNTVIDQHLG